MQTILALARPAVAALPRLAGAVLLGAAVDAQRTLLMRIEEPFAALANKVIPNVVMIPPRQPSDFNRDEAQARTVAPLMFGKHLLNNVLNFDHAQLQK